ncbi:hypothetical protein, partial [Thiolapillus sp.]|uniref:hypothetical protein n=1 Tax=Thiolapillus sp. TaxID=2017437 RepID=UPI003AF65898
MGKKSVTKCYKVLQNSDFPVDFLPHCDFMADMMPSRSIPGFDQTRNTTPSTRIVFGYAMYPSVLSACR